MASPFYRRRRALPQRGIPPRWRRSDAHRCPRPRHQRVLALDTDGVRAPHPRRPDCRVPSGLASPAHSAMFQQFLRGRSDSSPAPSAVPAAPTSKITIYGWSERGARVAFLWRSSGALSAGARLLWASAPRSAGRLLTIALTCPEARIEVPRPLPTSGCSGRFPLLALRLKMSRVRVVSLLVCPVAQYRPSLHPLLWWSFPGVERDG